MARITVPLPRVAHQFLRTSEGRWCRNALTVFHRWLGERALVLSDLTSSHIEQFWQQQEQKKLAYSTWYVRRCRIHKYLYWLDQKGHLHFAVDPPRLHHMRTSLPRPAQRFFDHCGNRRHEPAVKNLHDWMRRKRIALSELTPAHLETFLRQPIVHLIADNTSVQLRRHLEPYLLWLHDQGLVSFRATRDIYRPFPLPDVAQGFIDSLRPVLKASTCSGYVVDIRDLHAWLDAEGLPIESLDRRAVERWMKSLADRDLAPATRCHRVVHARSYLRWLAEHGTITTDPDYLLRTTDLPKLPSYLPRPFPMDADHELQRRFLQAGTIYGQALFLMRRSGMRVGELARLEPRCLDEDLQGRVFLKVPLGKLDNERLVPIDDQTSQLTRTLQTRSQTDSAFLIEPHFARSTVIEYLRAALKDVAEGLDIPGPVVSHRLRHTYATELLNAGVSLVTVMKLLGHRSIRMTMRYAAITQQTVAAEYYAAVAKTTARYDLPAPQTSPDVPDLDRALLDVIYTLRSLAGDNPDLRPQTDRFNRRLHKLRHDIAQAFPDLAKP